MTANILSVHATPAGTVYLVGAGPGDPELLTLRAAKLLGQAEVIVYDHLVSAGVLEFGRREAQRIYAGKERGDHTLSQTDINHLLVRLAKKGKRVVRLKGGDPFVFGRGGEEAEALAAAGIAFEVVPGITAACGVAAYSGIPLTHRDHANSCVFVAGHLKGGSLDLDWDWLARPGRTLVVYMGLLGLPTLCRELAAHGLPDATPAAIVQQGTTPHQRTVVGTLATLPRLALAAQLAPPTLIIIGDVVRLQSQLAWYETAPFRACAERKSSAG
jgi:uroporphyrin-III C-methyltransferase/precorrin-2 dehydrogenase/sirohydrochlorin ferrochelatase